MTASPITCVQYDETGELQNVLQVFHTEGRDVAPLPPDAATADRKAHAAKVDKALRDAAKATRDQLQAAADSGARLLVLPDGAELPEPGRHHVDPKTRKLARRSDAELAERQAAAEPS